VGQRCVLNVDRHLEVARLAEGLLTTINSDFFQLVVGVDEGVLQGLVRGDAFAGVERARFFQQVGEVGDLFLLLGVLGLVLKQVQEGGQRLVVHLDRLDVVLLRHGVGLLRQEVEVVVEVLVREKALFQQSCKCEYR